EGGSQVGVVVPPHVDGAADQEVAGVGVAGGQLGAGDAGLPDEARVAVVVPAGRLAELARVVPLAAAVVPQRVALHEPVEIRGWPRLLRLPAVVIDRVRAQVDDPEVVVVPRGHVNLAPATKVNPGKLENAHRVSPSLAAGPLADPGRASLSPLFS